MKRAWFQRIRGGGCQTLVYGGKTHVLPPFLVNLSIVLLLFGGGVNGWVVEAVIAFGGGCGRTVSSLPTCPLHPRLHYSPSCTHASILTLPVRLPCAEVGAVLLMHQSRALLVVRGPLFPFLLAASFTLARREQFTLTLFDVLLIRAQR